MSDESEALQHLRDMRRALNELIAVLKKIGSEREFASIRNDRPPEKLAYGIPEAANALGLSKDYVWKLVASGKIRSIKVGKRRLIAGEALEDFLQKRGAKKSLPSEPQ